MLTTTSFYVLLTISIVTKCIDCYVIDNAATRTIAKSQTDEKRSDFINNSSNNGDNSNDVNTTMNTTAIDNATVMPKSNEVIDFYPTWKTNTEDNIPSDVETGKFFSIFSFHWSGWSFRF